MGRIPIYQVDVFTDKIFRGNPAAVCVLQKPLGSALMLKIAAENNLSETAFLWPENNLYRIRYFTPVAEVDLCGHASLASAYVLSEFYNNSAEGFELATLRSGNITVTRQNDYFILNLPSDVLSEVPEWVEALQRILKTRVVQLFKGKTDFLAILEHYRNVQSTNPNLAELQKLDARGVIISARGYDSDFVSRFFAPSIGIAEDPVTGSAHASLVPYWSSVLNKDELTATQLSKRGGKLICRHLANRTEVAGQARLYLKGEIYID